MARIRPLASIPKGEPVGEKAGALTEKRKLALLSIHSLADNILGFESKTAKPVPLARLADLVWKDEEPYARQIFSAAISLSSPNDSNTVTEANLLAELRRQVLALLARHDPRWAKRLIQEDASAQTEARMEDHFSIAYDTLATEPAKSLSFAELSLQDGVFPYMVSYLLKLRSQNEPAANALFLKTLDRLLAMPAVDANELLHLGTYVFTSPRIDITDTRIPREAVVQTGVGNCLVYDISADRPRIPLELIRAYLGAASVILANGKTVSPQEQQVYYVAGYLLLPKAQKFAPELIGPMASSMAALMEHLAPELREPATYANLEAKPEKNLEETLAEIEKLRVERQRNERYLFLIFSLWSKKEFAKARTIAEKISDPEVQAKVNRLVDFGQGAGLLDAGASAIPGAEKIANKLPKDIERAVLWLAIARAYEKSGNKGRAIDAIQESLSAARSVQDGRRAFLILCAAGQLAELNPSFALTTLAESVRAFNAQKAVSTSESALIETVKVGYLKLYFPLKAKGIEYSLAQALRPTAAADADATLAAVAGLTDETRRAQAFVVLSEVILSRK
jgi:hypothetical protein